MAGKDSGAESCKLSTAAFTHIEPPLRFPLPLLFLLPFYIASTTEMDPMQEQPPQSQEQGVEILREYHPYPSRPLSPIIEESSAELPHGRKRVREGEATLDETVEDDREWKRQQMLDSHDTVETAATEANTETVSGEETNQVDGSNEEAAPLEAVHEEAGYEGADDEATDILEASVEEAATQIASPLWNFYAVFDSDDEDVEDEDILNSGSANQSTSASPSPPSEFDRAPSMTPAPEADTSFFVLPKDRWPAEPKSAQYRDALWSIVYNKNKTFMWEFHEGLAQGSLDLCKELLGRAQLPPQSLSL
ncbi:uncharacterized protein TrAtP1_001630 [Trichoderma atroviride]|uniref:uncharacterized protein n=1 Tax=Hypocrea atroviridis TaxID=63577 RepID=UPI003325C1DF|nr:hypothetical protein TrAtP1_001630 [Trichoderma atroviride]